MSSANQRKNEDLRIRSEFDRIASSILCSEQTELRSKPLSFWVTPRDRRLPTAFLPRTVDEIIRLPFDELAATTGVGPKKMEALVRLLARALERGVDGGSGEAVIEAASEPILANGFDPLAVSELQWTQWRESARRHQLGHETLGRLAGSLQDLPSVLWRVPLSTYFNATLADIRRLRTYGEKRVRVVLEIFHDLDRAFGRAEVASHLDIEVGPRRMRSVGRYLSEIERTGVLPSEQEILERVIEPIVEQFRVDLGDLVYDLVRERFGLSGEPQSVRTQATRLGVTRARIYQLLESCARVMEVRWPEGRRLMDAVLELRAADRRRSVDLSLFIGFRDLCFPAKSAAPAEIVQVRTRAPEETALISGI
jgi:hypothetical protein